MIRRKPEYFKITRHKRTYDKQTGKFTINIAYETAPPQTTKRVIAVAESFGLGLDESEKFTIYDNVELKIQQSDIIYITGESGSGKTVLLKTLEQDIKNSLKTQTINITTIKPEQDNPLIETLGKTFQQVLELLSKVGLNDAFLFLRSFEQLSDGQRYRYKIAKMIESKADVWIMDEFAATLDRDSAKIVAFNLQKLARQQRKTVLAATTHADLLEDLSPSIHIHKRYGKEITINYYPNRPRKQCSLTREMRITRGSNEDWRKLCAFHYRNHRAGAIRKILTLRRNEEICGVIVYSYPPPACFGRRLALPKTPLKELNKKLSMISRVVIHPKYRTIGLGSKIVKDTLPLVGTEYVEMTAVMAKYNPFAERAGMQKIAESKPNLNIQIAMDQLASLGISSTMLPSLDYDMNKIGQIGKEQIIRILTQLSRKESVLRKRLLAITTVYPTQEQFIETINSLSDEGLAKILRRLSFLKQMKVYLFWQRPEAQKK
jgi:ABC-type lipoprotein export system ATPase subunit